MRAIALLISCAAPAVAQDLRLGLPIDCTLGDTCYIQNYVDHDPTEGASDFQCAGLTNDGHKGTDIGLPSLAAMTAGVDVLVAAPGTVRGVRNDMRDILYTPDLDDEINGRDCGNGVVIAHDNGWETQYCHMKEGSVSVKSGVRVDTGDVLGQVGLSGKTQFPHVHLTVRRDGAVVDPFAPEGATTCTNAPETTLWATALDTPQGGLLSIGFASGVPDYDSVKAGTAAATTLSADTAIVLWGFAFGSRPGDTISISIDGPNGPFFQTDEILDRKQALVMRAGGLNPPIEGWPSGTYIGTVSHQRDGVELGILTTTIALP